MGLTALGAASSQRRHITFASDVVEAWADRLALVNAYGPSEASIEASCRLVRHTTFDPNNLGIPNDCIYWTVDKNDHNRLVPLG